MLSQLSTNTNINDVKITLKEITDLISVEHNKAMKVVEKLVKEPSFGLVEKIATMINVGFGEREIQTYQLNKKQAIAVGAKLNNPDGSTRITITTKITGKGQVALTQKIKKTFELKEVA